MKLPTNIQVFGKPEALDTASESTHAITFFNKLRREYPAYGAIATHIRNEGKRTQQQAMRQKAEGMTKGAADIIIPCCPPFICEMKSRNPNAKVSPEQIEYLTNAQALGAFVCIAIGYQGAFDAFECFLKKNKKSLQKN